MKMFFSYKKTARFTIFIKTLVLGPLVLGTLVLALFPRTAQNDEFSTSATRATSGFAINDLSKVFVLARVNGSAITNYDLDQSIRLFVATRNVTIDNPYDDKSLIKGILENLIDDVIKSQEAKRYNISVGEELLQQQVLQRVQQNNMTWQQMESFLLFHGVQFTTLKEQIKANLLWLRLVGARFGMLGNISNQSVERVIKGEQRARQSERVLLREILLSSNSSQEDIRKDLLEKIQNVKDLETFSNLAKEYSISPTSQNGGYLGWVNLLALTKKAVFVIRKTPQKNVTTPILLEEGDVVLYWIEEKVASTSQDLLTKNAHIVFITFSGKDALTNATDFRENTKDCTDLSIRALEQGAQAQDLGTRSLVSLNKNLAENILSHGAPYVFPPIQQDQNYRLVVSCSIGHSITQDATQRQKIEATLANQEMLLASQRYFQNLRREAVIDYYIAP